MTKQIMLHVHKIIAVCGQKNGKILPVFLSESAESRHIPVKAERTHCIQGHHVIQRNIEIISAGLLEAVIHIAVAGTLGVEVKHKVLIICDSVWGAEKYHFRLEVTDILSAL